MSKRTTVTEFCRFLNDNMGEMPEFETLFTEYMSGVHQQLKAGMRAGYWLHDKHLPIFRKWFKWWKKHPELWGIVYEGCDAATNPDILPPFMEKK
jgi:hypothetical protein